MFILGLILLIANVALGTVVAVTTDRFPWAALIGTAAASFVVVSAWPGA